MKKLFLFVALFGVFTLFGCNEAPVDDAAYEPDVADEVEVTDADAPDTIMVTHRSGETEVPVNPQNIAVFDMAILDSLALMGLSDRVVGMPQNAIPYVVSQFRDMDVADFGTLHEPNLEAMAGYELDLIIISGRARPFFDELSQLAPTIDLGLAIADMRGTFLGNQRYLGQIFQMEDAWEAELAEIIALFDEANELSAQLEDQEALIIMYNEGNYQAFGPGGRFGIIHDVFGVPYVDAEVGIGEDGTHVNHGVTINNEYIYSVNPAIIFIIDRNYTLDGGNPALHESGFGVANEIVALTTAGQNGHIFDMNPEAWYIAPGGLQSMRIQVTNVIDALRNVVN